ncbi:MAG: S8 family serine peptidase, partial [Thaumarchaeota archaeon]|nr:S8 family serine peptidase [Nitrososphaerota archaeon]
AIQVRINAVVPPQTGVRLAIEELPTGNGPRQLTFANGALSAPLTNGANTLTLTLKKDQPATGGKALLKIQDAAGRVFSRFTLRLVVPDVDALGLSSLFLNPREAVIPATAQTVQLAVGGVVNDGRVVNLTAAASGTTYTSADEVIAAVNAEGVVTGKAGGTTTVSVANHGLTATGTVRVEHPPILIGMTVNKSFVTLIAQGEQHPLTATGLLSNGSTQDVTASSTFTSSNTAVVTVAGGVLTAVGEGAATITVTNGTFQGQVQVAGEFRVTPNVTAIDLAPFTQLVTTDQGEVLARATISGTGSLQGLTVRFAVDGANPGETTGTTDYSGVALATLQGLATAGARTVTASVVNPTTNATLTDTESLMIEAGSGDNEPNDDPNAASRLTPGKTITGTLNGANDPQDIFKMGSTTGGVLSITLTLPSGTNLSDIRVIVRSANGTELGRFTPSDLTSTFTQQIGAEQVFVEIETTGSSSVSYSLRIATEQGPLTITNATPTSGGPGTLVTITGSGFSTQLADNTVTFGGIVGKVVSATTTTLQALAPAAALNGPIKVIVGAQEAVGPQFTPTGPPLVSSFTPPNPAMIRRDPVTNQLLDVNRLLVEFDPTVTRPQVEAVTTGLGGAIVGFLPVFNTYVLEFARVTSIAEIEARRNQLKTSSLVRFTARSTYKTHSAFSFDSENESKKLSKGIDVLDPRRPGLKVSYDHAFQEIKLYDAIRTVRNHPNFTTPNFKKVTVAVIDSGFNPASTDEVTFKSGDNTAKIVKLINAVGIDSFLPFSSTGLLPEQKEYSDLDGHGTESTGVIVALNNTNLMNGILGGLFIPKVEAPSFTALVYRTDIELPVKIKDQQTIECDPCAFRALEDIYLRNKDESTAIDVVNISLAQGYSEKDGSYFDDLYDYESRFNLLALRTLVTVSAGNAGIDANLVVPAVLASQLNNVVTVGAVDPYGTRARFTERTREENSAAEIPKNFPVSHYCRSDTEKYTGSNCGEDVTLAAPGVRVQTLGIDVPEKFPKGTSIAAPLVTGIAAMLQAIRGQEQPFSPAALRKILVDTGTRLSRDQWDDNLRSEPMPKLDALSAVRAVLPPLPNTQTVFVADHDLNQVVPLAVDPLTGQNTAGVNIPIPLERKGENPVSGTGPVAIAASPAATVGGNGIYVVVENSTAGPGVMRIDPISLKVDSFIAFPPGQTPTAKSRAVFSKDGDLLYVSTNQGLVIVNTFDEQPVEKCSDLPARYQPSSLCLLLPNLTNLRRQLGGAVVALEVSPDGKTLYAAHLAGADGEEVTAVNIDLYTDADSNTIGLQSDLTHYLEIRQRFTTEAEGPSGGPDSPKGMAVSPDGKYVYVVHGAGIYSPQSPDLSTLNKLVGEAIFSAGYFGPIADIPRFLAKQASFVDKLRAQYQNILQEGETILYAPGTTEVYNVQSGNGAPQDAFLSNLRMGGARGPVRVNEPVFARRPFGMAMRPDGRRALVPFFQTGNFGVLDLFTQQIQELLNGWRRDPAQPFDAFWGFIGVTPSIKLDNHLFPRNPADTALLYPQRIQYAQNGRFAVATHTGSSIPAKCIKTDPATGQQKEEPCPRAGEFIGSVSIINDQDITFDLNVSGSLTDNQTSSSFYSMNPICKTRDRSNPTRCIETVTTSLPEYQPDKPFRRPQDVAIQPFVTFLTPRFGDYVRSGASIFAEWKDSRVTKVEFTVYDLGAPNEPPSSVQVGQATVPDGDADSWMIPRKVAARDFSQLFSSSLPPQAGHRYKIEARVLVGTEELSKEYIIVTFEG